MKKVTIFLSLLLLASCSGKKAVVLFENDVHCHVEGYTKLAALRDSLESEGHDVLTVSCGDFLSGGTVGMVSKGFFIIRYMNAVGYDAVTIGNHEFDYTARRMVQTLDKLESKKVCCNFREKGKQIYPGYTVSLRGERKIGFVGVVTPTTLTTSTPSYFKDSLGNTIYGFSQDNIVTLVQESVDAARKDGADYVVLLSHLGDRYNPVITSRALIERTEGIDAVLDGHEHREIEGDTLKNRNGSPVILSSTGCYFKNIGILEIEGKSIRTYLKRTASIQGSNSRIDILGKEIDSAITFITADKPLGRTDCDIRYGKRNCESALGDLVTDAIRKYFGTDIAFVNTGLLRENIKKGEIRYSDISDACPFGDYVHKGKVKGSEILDMLEKASSAAPAPSGGFMQVSGMTYCIDTCTESSVVSDKERIFVKVAGKRRVHSVKVMGKPLSPDSIYSVASIDYILMKNGDGIRFFDLTFDNIESQHINKIIGEYIQGFNGGDLGNRYAKPDNRITYSPVK